MNISKIIVIIVIVIIIILTLYYVFKYNLKLFGIGDVWDKYIEQPDKNKTWFYVKKPRDVFIDKSIKHNIEWKLHISFPKNDKNKQIIVDTIETLINENENGNAINWKINNNEHISETEKARNIKNAIENLKASKFIGPSDLNYSKYNKYPELFIEESYYIIKLFDKFANLYTYHQVLIDEIHLIIDKLNEINEEYGDKNKYYIELQYNDAGTMIGMDIFEYLKDEEPKYSISFRYLIENMNSSDFTCFTDLIDYTFEYIKLWYICNLGFNNGSVVYDYELIDFDTNYINKCINQMPHIRGEIRNEINSIYSFIRNYRNLANDIENNKFITIYVPESEINEFANNLNDEFKKNNIEFENLYTEYKIHDGIYTRLAETSEQYGDEINRYTPYITRKTFLEYVEQYKFNYNFENVIDTQIKHPFDNLYYYNFDSLNDEYILLPKNIIDINKRLPKILRFNLNDNYNIDY